MEQLNCITCKQLTSSKTKWRVSPELLVKLSVVSDDVTLMQNFFVGKRSTVLHRFGYGYHTDPKTL